MSEQTEEKLFASGKAAMMTAGPWALANILQDQLNLKLGTDYAVATIPTQQAGGQSATSSGGWQIGVNAKSKNQAAADKFLAYFEQSNNLISLASSNSFPPLVDGMSGKPFSTDPFDTPFKQMLPNSGLPISTDEARAAYDVRATLEPLAVAGLVDRLTPDILAELDHYVSEMLIAAAADDLPKLIEAHARFHCVVWSNSGTDTLTRVWPLVEASMRNLTLVSNRIYFHSLEQVALTHRPRLAGLRSRNPAIGTMFHDHALEVWTHFREDEEAEPKSGTESSVS